MMKNISALPPTPQPSSPVCEGGGPLAFFFSSHSSLSLLRRGGGDGGRGRLIAAVSLVVIVLLAALLWWPLPRRLMEKGANAPVRVFDRTGTLLYQTGNGPASFLPFARIPPDAIRALIATEDQTFWSHPGISLRGIARSIIQNSEAGQVVSGGSTITQQLVRARLQPKNRGFFYKIVEAYDALRLERLLSKKQIVESYLNTAYFGHQAYGFIAAAHTYFGKEPDELSLQENAFLIGLLQSPSDYDPFRAPALARARQKAVLAALRNHGDISAVQYADAAAVPIRLHADRTNITAPHFVFWMLQQHADQLRRGGDLHTTLDANLQSQTEQIVANHLKLLQEKNVTSAAVVTLDARTGDVLSMLGSADYFDTAHDGQVNVAISARQPGSALKPFTYALALAGGDTLATTVADVETQFFTQDGNPYTPRNYDFDFHGLVRYRDALANSYNVPAVKVLQKIGVQSLLDFLKRDGITTLGDDPSHYGLALTLGDGEVKLLELARAYGIFARGGATLPLRTLINQPIRHGDKILPLAVSWLIAKALSDNAARLPEFGENSPLQFPFPVAAKTGTTRNSRDNWTIGFTPDRIVGVWVGNADNSPMKDTSGVTGAAPIFHDVMLAAEQGLHPEDFLRPPGITAQEICMLSGKLPTPLCPAVMQEYFAQGTQPRTPDEMFRSLAIDTRNGLLANASCPAPFVIQKTFTIFPPEARSWARERGFPLPPSGHSPLCAASARSASGTWILIGHPQQNAAYQLDPTIPAMQQKVPFDAEASPGISAISWYVNGAKAGEGTAPDFSFFWTPSVGNFTVEARADKADDVRNIRVEKPQ